MKEII